MSFTTRGVDLYKVYNDFDLTKTHGSTVALVFASSVSEFKFFLSLWSGNSSNSIMWHLSLVFNALSLSTGANLAWFRVSGGSQEPSERKGHE